MKGFMETGCMPESHSEWEKKEKLKQKKIDMLKKKLPGNQVVKELHGGLEQKRKTDSGHWDLVDRVVWAAREAYMEEGLTFEQSVNQLKEALDYLAEICTEDEKTKDEEYEHMKDVAKA